MRKSQRKKIGDAVHTVLCSHFDVRALSEATPRWEGAHSPRAGVQAHEMLPGDRFVRVSDYRATAYDGEKEHTFEFGHLLPGMWAKLIGEWLTELFPARQ